MTLLIWIASFRGAPLGTIPIAARDSCFPTDRLKMARISRPSIRMPFQIRIKSFCWNLLWALLLSSLLWRNTVADFGDYVDPTYNCPATTTCKQVCVAQASDCPVAMSCEPILNQTLCADGSCAEECDDNLKSPCPYECAPIACQKTIDTLDNCKADYDTYYTNEAACGLAEVEAKASALHPFRRQAMNVFYAWIVIITILIFLWCFFNQKVAPVSGSSQTMEVEKRVVSATGGDAAVCWQTGYKVHFMGGILHVATLATFTAFILALALLSIEYYDRNGSNADRTVDLIGQQELLKAFIITWSVGIFWCFMVKWPFSIQSIFLRRCLLSQATHVAIYLDTGRHDSAYVAPNALVAFLKSAFFGVQTCYVAIMSFFFSDVDGFHRRGGMFQYCRVQRDLDGSKYFVFLFRRYNFDADSNAFVPGVWLVGETLGDLATTASGPNGLTPDEITARRRVVGDNVIEMEKPFFPMVIFREFAKPFYTYQLFIILSWFPLDYYYMAVTWTFVIVSSALAIAWFHYRNLRNLHRITHVFGQAEVLRDGRFTAVDQSDLVPGDIVKLSSGIVYCDMVVTSSSALLMDESALTGESTPQGKVPIDPANAAAKYDSTVHKRHTISAGTTVMETDNSIAVVLQTGSYTAKGELLREIFSFRRHQFKFDTEVVIVIGILALYAIVGFNIVLQLIEDKAVYGWFYGVYVIAATLPPLLPTVFTVSVGVSDERLARKRIATVNSESILIAGKVTRAFFDKTGTLTKQGLDFLSVNSATTWNENSSTISNELGLAMASCHTLTQSQSGLLIGNPVDRAMFDASGATFISSTATMSTVTDRNGNQVEIVRYFDFDHHRMTQSVIVRLADGTLTAFVKGSGENIRRICNQSSLPVDFDTSLRDSARAGIYQISVACKSIQSPGIDQMTRDEVENNLDFVGVLNFKNVMRAETPEVIRHLAVGEVKSIMVTGDSVLTGISIAKESGIMAEGIPVIIGNVTESGDVVWTNEAGTTVNAPTSEQLESGSVEVAVFGRAWQALSQNHPKEASRLMQHIRVYGRCTPHDKVAVVDSFVNLGFITLMCGDGGNDCGALKAAHVGVALSDAEASIVSPFTSLDKTIASVVDVLREGRCALASALATYKYIILYGQMTTINQIITAYFQVTFSEWCWVFLDGVWTITLAFALPLAKPADHLSPTRPTASLLGLQTLSSAIGILVLNFFFTVVALLALESQDWYQCRKWDSTDVSNVLVIGDNYETEVMFLVTGYQYISTAMAFNFGYEFRKGWFRNYIFVVFAALFTFLMFYSALVSSDLSCIWRVNCTNENVSKSVTSKEPLPIQNPFNTTEMPTSFRWTIVVIMIVNTFVICAYDYFVVNGIRRRYAAKRRLQRNTASAPSSNSFEVV